MDILHRVARRLRRSRMTLAYGFARAHNGRGFRKNEAVNATVLPRGAFIIFYG